MGAVRDAGNAAFPDGVNPDKALIRNAFGVIEDTSVTLNDPQTIPAQKKMPGGIASLPHFLNVDDAVRASYVDASVASRLVSCGKALGINSSYSFMAGAVESPTVFWSRTFQKWCMLFSAYDVAVDSDPTHAHGVIGRAWASHPLGPWIAESTPFWTPVMDGLGGTGVTGSAAWYDDDGGFIFCYCVTGVGGAGTGYEAFPINLRMAKATSESGTLTVLGTVITGLASGLPGWISNAPYRVRPIAVNGTKYLFMNANGTIGGVTKERIGFMTAASWTDFATSNKTISAHPVLDVGTSGSFDQDIAGDPCIRKVGTTFVMPYFGAKLGSPTTSTDGYAYTQELDFPWGPGGEPTPWIKNFSGGSPNPILIQNSASAFDNSYASKPEEIFHEGILYHFYTALGVEGRQIGVAMSTPPLTFERYPYSPTTPVSFVHSVDTIIPGTQFPFPVRSNPAMTQESRFRCDQARIILDIDTGGTSPWITYTLSGGTQFSSNMIAKPTGTGRQVYTGPWCSIDNIVDNYQRINAVALGSHNFTLYGIYLERKYVF